LNELTIWGRENSINVQKVLWLCEDLQIIYQRVDAGMEHGVNKTPEYLKINPNGLVPTISDNGFILWESHAIMRYLLRRLPSNSSEISAYDSIYPREAKAGALVDQWLDWTNTVAWPAMRPLFWGWVRLKPEERNLQDLENSRQLMIKALTMFDQQLSFSAYAAGEEFTLADIPMALIAYRWFKIPIERPEFRNLNRWYSRVGERAGFKRYCSGPLT
jgi:glutathione S-transferase